MEQIGVNGSRRLLVAVCVLLAGARSAAGAEWRDMRVAPPLVCRADFSLAGYEPLLAGLQQLEQELVAELGLRPRGEPIEMYLFGEPSAYRAYVENHYPHLTPKRALYVKGRGPGRIYAQCSDELETDLRHELVHAVLHARLPLVPLWLDEGLAEHFEKPGDKRGGAIRLVSIPWQVRLGTFPRLEALEQVGKLEQFGRREYDGAGVWVGFMLDGPGEAKEELVGYLRELQAGKLPQPLSQRLSRRLPQLDERLSEHFRSLRR